MKPVNMNYDNKYKIVISKNATLNMLQREYIALMQDVIDYCIKLNVELTKTEDINGNVVFYVPNSISSKIEGYFDGYLAAIGYVADSVILGNHNNNEDTNGTTK